MAEDRLLAAWGILEVPIICLPNALIRENDDDIILFKPTLDPYNIAPKTAPADERAARQFQNLLSESAAFMPTAHLIHGYLGAGKTTFARQLERNIPAIRFSHDEWMVRLLWQ